MVVSESTGHEFWAAPAVWMVEQGLAPDALTRAGIRLLLRDRLRATGGTDQSRVSTQRAAFIREMDSAPVALLTEAANAQHYELPAEFFATVLGPHLKYSCCHWTDPQATLADAERSALVHTCTRAELADGQDILELGCGWGSLTLWMAEQYPRARITAISNSQSQREFIMAAAARRQFGNVQVLTADMNEFTIAGRFDRIVSVEMFEHMRNWRALFARARRWLREDGRFFLHVFAHRGAPYAFEPRGPSDWMSRFFFSGGMMPSVDLVHAFSDELTVAREWWWEGEHYRRTAAAWRNRLETRRAEVMPILQRAYGADAAPLWYTRWRLFFLACEELFGFEAGARWGVGHYLLAPGVQRP